MLDINYFNQTIPTTSCYLDLGGALTAAGLIGVVYQFRTPLWDLVLRIRPSWQRYSVWILGALGLVIILLRVIFFETDLKAYLPHILNNSVYYEIIAFVLFIMSPLSMVYFSVNSKLFKNGNKRDFYNELTKEISKGNDASILAAFELIMLNFDDICESMKEADIDTSELDRFMINVVMSDNRMVEILTTKRLDSLIYFFRTIEKYNLDQKDLIVCVPKIIRNLLLESQSFFFKHAEMEGLAISSNIYDILSSPQLLKKFNFHGDPLFHYHFEKNGEVMGIKVYINFLSKVIEAYRKGLEIPSLHPNCGLQNLSEILKNCCRKINKQENDGTEIRNKLNDSKEILSQIVSFLGKFEEIHDENLEINTNNFNNRTVNSAFANVLSRAFEDLSYIEDTHYVYFLLIELFHGLEFRGEKTTRYRVEFEVKMWLSVDKNINGRCYPAALRTYLIYFGMYLAPNCLYKNKWMNDQVERMRRLLYFDLKPLLDQNEMMVNQKSMKDVLLPKDVIYDDGYFTYVDRSNNRNKIAPPSGYPMSAAECHKTQIVQTSADSLL